MDVAGFKELAGYLTSPFLWEGALVALEIGVLAMLLGAVLGLPLALLRTSRLRPVRSAAWVYIWFFRGTPQLLQLVFIFDVLPVVGLRFNSFATAVIGFGLSQAAFSAESIRGGILAVDRSQSSAAASLGMGPVLTLRRIVLPQAMRIILPGMFGDLINLLKLTAIASIIFVNELTFRAQQIVGQNFRFFTVFAATAAIYLMMTSVLSGLQELTERRFDLDRRHVPKSDLLAALSRRIFRRLPEAAEAPSIHVTPDGAGAALVGARRGGPADENFVVCTNVQKSYDGRQVLAGIDLTVRRGEVVVLLGPSGSGKSTLLRMINHLETVDWGEITVGGRHIGYERIPGGVRPTRGVAKARAEAGISMVFQHFNLFSHLSARENIMEAPVRVHGVAPATAHDTATRLLGEVGLESHADHLPHRLSGGQQQRVAIARALAIAPQLMLFDEPTSALDPELVGDVLQVMRRLARSGMTMIVVTHEIRFARDVADRVVFMDAGTVVEQGHPRQVIDAPREERTRRFLRTAGQADRQKGTAETV